MISLKHIKNSKKQQQYYLLDGQREKEFILTKQIHSHKQQFILDGQNHQTVTIEAIQLLLLTTGENA